MLQIEPFRGIVWRLRPLFETRGMFSGNKATRSAAVTLIRAAGNLQNLYLPTEQWKAGFDYVAPPSTKMNSTLEATNRKPFVSGNQVPPAKGARHPQ